MKKKIKDSLRHLPGIVATLFLLAAAACMPESFKPGIETPGSQDRSPMTLEFDFSSSDVGIRTRANEDPMNDKTINSLWVGVFDVETGNLVGTCSKNQNKKNKDTVTVDILYYDAHPTVRIFGVANYEGITGSSERLPGNDLKSLLDQVTTMSQFFSISVDTQSADKRLESGAAPLLMGVYTLDGNSAGLYTVAAEDESGENFKPSDKDSDITSDITLVTGTYDRFKRLTGGAIRLRRLLSQVNVQVKAGSDVSLTNIRYRVVNKPTQVYLQERTTQTTALDEDEWKVKSPNRADAIDGGYMSDEFSDPIAALPTNPDEPVFSFYQYENKHWGWGNLSTYNDREEVIQGENGPIFTALCGAEGDHWYNNNASYFEIKMDVEVEEDGKTIRAKDVTYRIHEGYCNDAAGNRSENNLFDFTCVRNTVYTYKITISGLTSITVDTETGEHKHTPGVLGGAEFFTESTKYEPITIDPNNDSEGTSHEFHEVLAAAYICYYANGGSPKYYAGGDKEGIDKLMESPILPAGFKEAKEGEPIDFGFTFGEERISDIFSPTTRAGEMNTTTISGTIGTYPDVSNVNPEDYKMSLYLLLTSEDLGDDDCVNNTYTYIDALPLDSRQGMGEFDFSLAFANDWDEDPTESNGAVVGHLKKIRVTDLEWKSTERPDGLKYTVFLDDKLIADEITTWPFDLEEEFTYTANSVHTIKVVAEDPDNKYKPCTISQEFIVYPTTFTWDYTQISLQASVAQNSYYYGSNFTPKEGASDDIYSGIKHLLSKMTTGTQTNVGNFIQTGGTGNAFEINALYDAVLTIYPSHTSTENWSHLVTDNPSYRYLKVTSSDNSEELSYAAIPKPKVVGDLIPFTFYVKKGQVNIYTGGSLNIYKIELTYIGYPSTPRTNVWSFDETKWTGSIDYINSFKDSNPFPPISLSIDGLRLETTSARISKGTSLIKLDGGGDFDKKERLFSFMAYKSGKLELSVADAGGDGTRYMKIKVGDQVTELKKLPASKQQTSQTYQVDIDKPTRVYITSGSGGINVYSIKFEESK